MWMSTLNTNLQGFREPLKQNPARSNTKRMNTKRLLTDNSALKKANWRWKSQITSYLLQLVNLWEQIEKLGRKPQRSEYILSSFIRNILYFVVGLIQDILVPVFFRMPLKLTAMCFILRPLVFILVLQNLYLDVFGNVITFIYNIQLKYSVIICFTIRNLWYRKTTLTFSTIFVI